MHRIRIVLGLEWGHTMIMPDAQVAIRLRARVRVPPNPNPNPKLLAEVKTGKIKGISSDGAGVGYGVRRKWSRPQDKH